MKLTRRRFLTISAAFAACPARAEVSAWQADAFGGVLRVDLRGPLPLGQDMADRIGARIAAFEAMFSLFRPDSLLSRLNARGRLDDPPAGMQAILALADQAHRATGGRFDPTVQPLWRALAEGGDVAAARARIGWGRVGRDSGIRLARGQALTLNGIAQGFVADRIGDLLRGAGYGEVLIDMGEFLALGGPFALSIEDPLLGPVATRRLAEGAIATSSPAAMLVGGLPHILGPEGQMPLWSTISVEAANAALADAASTAFCLMPAPAIRSAMPPLGVTRVTAVDLGGDVSTFQHPGGRGGPVF